MAEINFGMTSNPFLGKENPYLQQNIDSTMGDITRNYNLAVKPQTASMKAGSGSFGNSGLQQLETERQRQLADTLGKTAGGMRMQDYGNQQNMYQWDQGFNNNIFQQGVQNNQQNLSNYMGLLNQGNQFNQQDITNSTSMYNTPLNYQTQFSNMAGGLGGLGDTQSQTNPGSPMLGAIGGWQLGNAFSNPASFFK